MRNSKDRYTGGKENSFYAKPNTGDIIKKKPLSIDDIKDNITLSERSVP